MSKINRDYWGDMQKQSIEDDLIEEIKRLVAENVALKAKIQVLRDLLLDR